jgi:hypothetical protein
MVWIQGGLHVEGTPEDINTFRNWLEAASGLSPVFRSALRNIEKDRAHPTWLVLGHGQPHVFGDAFASRQVDMDDLGRFPLGVGPGDNQVTRGELILHFLEERWILAHGSGFGYAHFKGIGAQNGVRKDLHQTSRVVAMIEGQDSTTGGPAAVIVFGDNLPGHVRGPRFRLAEFVPLNANGDIVGQGHMGLTWY